MQSRMLHSDPERFAIRASSPSDKLEDGAYWPGQISAH